MNLRPGLEVRLHSGAPGVLFSQVSTLGRRSRTNEERWYFLPDAAGAAGLVVLSQPKEIGASEVEALGSVREGCWPAPEYRLGALERQRVYVAWMNGARHFDAPLWESSPAPLA